MRVIVSIAIIGGIIAIFFLNTEPSADPKVTSSEKIQPEEQEDEPRARRIATERVGKETNTQAAAVDLPEERPADPQSPAVEEESPEPPKGPFTVSLGQHTVQLKDDARKRAVQFELQLVTQTDKTRKEIRRRRRDLVRMTYFLGSKRQADGAIGAAGRLRFERDLMERFQNVVRTGGIDSLKLVNYRVFSRAKDAGVDQ